VTARFGGNGRAALGSIAFLLVAPGTAAGLIPWWLTRWERTALSSARLPVPVLGALLLVGGCAVLLHAFARFVAVAVLAFVRWYEEATLRWRFGEEYDAYRRAVPGWWPRRRPWRRPEEPSSSS
jgi:protein-S-isoprenylcysteine O-methyltransferase Ste14